MIWQILHRSQNQPSEGEPLQCDPAEQLYVRIERGKRDEHPDRNFVGTKIAPSRAARSPGNQNNWRDEQEQAEELEITPNAQMFFHFRSCPIEKDDVEEKKERSGLNQRARE